MLPAISAGAAQRMSCQNGKFHGMIASTTPSGSQRDVAGRGVGGDLLAGEVAFGVLGEVLAGPGALLDLGLGGRDRLAHLGRRERRQLGDATAEHLGGRAQVRAAGIQVEGSPRRKARAAAATRRSISVASCSG